MTSPTPNPEIPDLADRHALNAALAATGAETGFWNDQGRPAPWPHDINQWAPTSEPTTIEPEQQPF
jgi:hypothetical protein